MQPNDIELQLERGVLYWKNTSFRLSASGATTRAERIRTLIMNNTVRVVLVDNRGILGTWSKEVEAVWSELMLSLSPTLIAYVTIAEPICVMQINRLSAKAGTLNNVQAFSCMAAALEFIDDLCRRKAPSLRSPASATITRICAPELGRRRQVGRHVER